MPATSEPLGRALFTLRRLAQLCTELSESEVHQVVEEMGRVLPTRVTQALHREPQAASAGTEPRHKGNAMFGERMPLPDRN